jgi:hypothetical protein
MTTTDPTLDFDTWLGREIYARHEGKKKVIPYKPALEPAFVKAFATPGTLRSYKADYNKWKKYAVRGVL